ncbi:unnamed protein product [Camellia sinensis]
MNLSIWVSWCCVLIFFSAMFNCWRRNNEAFSQTLFVLLLGQVVSFTVAVMSFTSSLLSNLGVYMPLTLSFFTYLSVSLVYGSIFLVRRQKLMVSWHWYLLLGFIDVQGNYLVNKAYQFSSITSVTILDCWTIAWAMILTWIFIGTQYSLSQFLGAAFCVMGLGLVLLSDAGVGGGGGTKPLLGDTLVIAGTLFFAMSNVSEEFCVKNKDRIEVVSMVALFGLIVSVCQIFLLERKSLESVKWSAEIIFCLVGYALASFILYSLIPFVLKMSGSTMYSLSILTSDMWAVVIRVFFYHQKVDWLYYLSFAIVVLGLIIYSKSEKKPATEAAHEDGDIGVQDQLLNEEKCSI